jgi:hypothetical protein
MVVVGRLAVARDFAARDEFRHASSTAA